MRFAGESAPATAPLASTMSGVWQIGDLASPAAADQRRVNRTARVAMCGTVTRRLGDRATLADDTRIDRWLCAVRLVKTRPMASQLCEGGHVRVNGNPAKPSTKVRAGDVVHARIAERERIVEVVRPIETRVSALVAATCYVDNSAPPPVRQIAPGIKAVRGEGRPSKRLRRDLERIRRAGPA
jgi:ribosome-associated heat shock protein Hsp15